MIDITKVTLRQLVEIGYDERASDVAVKANEAFAPKKRPPVRIRKDDAPRPDERAAAPTRRPPRDPR